MIIANRYQPTGPKKWGGMGEVYECEDLHLLRRVMLKRIIDPINAHRLIDEQKALLRLRSRHVVELLDIVEYDYMSSRETGIILEFIDGKGLSEGSYTFDTHYIQCLWQISAGLCDIHAAGIIHRDIKPDNIKIDSSGVVKILDFGLAREEGKDNKTRSLIGTFDFMAPELKGKETINFTSAIDVFAFGVLSISLIRPILASTTDFSSEIDLAIPAREPELRSILKSCLEVDPKKRPTALAIRDFLARMILKDQHRARIINGSTVHLINSSNRKVKIKTSVGGIEIEYDGHLFRCLSVTGDVSLNNIPIRVGDPLTHSCVLIFGSASSHGRAFIPFDVSSPEVML